MELIHGKTKVRDHRKTKFKGSIVLTQYPQSYELHLSSDDDGNSTIPDKGYEWDTGIHYVGNSINADSGSSTGKVLEFLTDSKLKWESMGDLIDVIKLKAKVVPILT